MTDRYGDLFSDGIEVVGRILRVLGWVVCGIVVLPVMAVVAVVMAPFVGLGWVAGQCGFVSKWR